jgi:hypothetical protein
MTKHDEDVEARKALVQGVLNWALDAADTNEDRDWITAAMNAFGELTASLSTARGEERSTHAPRSKQPQVDLEALFTPPAPGEHAALIAEAKTLVDLGWPEEDEPNLTLAIDLVRRLAAALEGKPGGEIECNPPFERVPQCACDPGFGDPPIHTQRLECQLRGGPCSGRPQPPEASIPINPTDGREEVVQHTNDRRSVDHASHTKQPPVNAAGGARWKLVPVEPDTGMKRALIKWRGYDPDAKEETLDRIGQLDIATMGVFLEAYQVMIAASPIPSEPHA